MTNYIPTDADENYYSINTTGFFFWGVAGPIAGANAIFSSNNSGMAFSNSTANVNITPTSVSASSVQGADELGSI